MKSLEKPGCIQGSFFRDLFEEEPRFIAAYLEHGGDPNKDIVCCEDGKTLVTVTPLIFLCRYKINLTDTPTFWFQRLFKNRQLIASLVASGADLDRTDFKSKTALMILSERLLKHKKLLTDLNGIIALDDIFSWLLRLEKTPEDVLEKDHKISTLKHARKRRKKLIQYHEEGLIQPEVFEAITTKLALPADEPKVP